MPSRFAKERRSKRCGLTVVSDSLAAKPVMGQHFSCQRFAGWVN
ncbi:hypothetical protein [Adhaeribacter aquaticus]|nr:hypothetical protein [Adhaeribacter aquaticus]